MANLIPLNILIGDRTYRIKVAPEDEGTVRNTLKVIHDKILEFKSTYAGKDMQDYISMVLIWFATQPSKSMAADLVNADLQEILGKMEKAIDEVA